MAIRSQKNESFDVGESATSAFVSGDVGEVRPRVRTRYRSKRWSKCLACQDMFKRPRGRGKKLCCPPCDGARRAAQVAAMAAVHSAVRAGDLPHHSTLKCVDCGAPASGFEHRDYSKKLQVEPICAKCNSARGPAAIHPFYGGVQMQVPNKSQWRKQDFTKSLAKRWSDLSPDIADKSAVGPVWLQLEGAPEPVKWLRPITMIEAKRIGANKWAAHYTTDSLSTRELDIFISLASGKTCSQIAAEKFLSVKTVSTHRSRIVEKTGIKNNVEMAIYAYQVGLVEWPREPKVAGSAA